MIFSFKMLEASPRCRAEELGNYGGGFWVDGLKSSFDQQSSYYLADMEAESPIS